MPISDEELSNLYENFKNHEKGKGEEFTEERRTKKKFFQKKLSPENIDHLSEGDIREIIRELWAFQMWTNKDYLVEEMLKDGIENLKNKLQTALHDSPNKGEAYNLLTEEVRMMGPASASELLTCVFPNECGIWNEKARKGLEILSYSEDLPLDKKKIDGKEYAKFNEYLSEVSDRLEKLGDGLEDFLELDYFLFYVVTESSEEKEEPVEDFSHDEMIETLLEIGDGLGFDVDKEYQAGPGARIDVRWSTKVANLGRIAYAFEVQRKGSRDSAILNLQKAKNADPSLQKLVIISTVKQLEKFRNEIDALDENFRKFVSYMSVDNVMSASQKLRDLKELLQEAGLMEEIG